MCVCTTFILTTIYLYEKYPPGWSYNQILVTYEIYIKMMHMLPLYTEICIVFSPDTSNRHQIYRYYNYKNE